MDSALEMIAEQLSLAEVLRYNIQFQLCNLRTDMLEAVRLSERVVLVWHSEAQEFYTFYVNGGKEAVLDEDEEEDEEGEGEGEEEEGGGVQAEEVVVQPTTVDFFASVRIQVLTFDEEEKEEEAPVLKRKATGGGTGGDGTGGDGSGEDLRKDLGGGLWGVRRVKVEREGVGRHSDPILAQRANVGYGGRGRHQSAPIVAQSASINLQTPRVKGGGEGRGGSALIVEHSAYVMAQTPRVNEGGVGRRQSAMSSVPAKGRRVERDSLVVGSESGEPNRDIDHPLGF